MEDSNRSRTAAVQTARLERTLTDLRNRIKYHEDVFKKLRADSKSVLSIPSQHSSVQLRQLRVFESAYKTHTPREPFLPSTDSPIPALFALHITHQGIQDSKKTLTSSQVELEKTEQRLEKEQSDLREASLITQSLEERIESLRESIRLRTQMSPTQTTKEMMRELKLKKINYDKETGKMVKAFNAFVDNHLAAMLAAEELGGPVVGNMPDVDELSLESGFNSQGKAKKQKMSQNNEKRQRRIDEIWGQNFTNSVISEQPRDETRAAAADMRSLTERLLNGLVDANSAGGDAYIELERESAAARFLVRSKVAQFHPRDARLLRLVDFGRDLDE